MDIYALIFLFFAIAIYIWWCVDRVKDWKLRAACTEPICGRLKEKGSYSRGKGRRRFFRFTYVYRGREYTETVFEEPSKKDYKNYQIEGEYTIYINPQKPRNVRYRKLEPKFFFLLYTVRGILLLCSVSCPVPMAMLNIQNMQMGMQVTLLDWVPPIFWIIVFICCIISINS